LPVGRFPGTRGGVRGHHAVGRARRLGRIVVRWVGDRLGGWTTLPVSAPNSCELSGTHREAHAALPGCCTLPVLPVGLIGCEDRVPVALVAAVKPVAR
jgi:hypothetical protein